jgi:hypothetical protein
LSSAARFGVRVRVRVRAWARARARVRARARARARVTARVRLRLRLRVRVRNRARVGVTARVRAASGLSSAGRSDTTDMCAWVPIGYRVLVSRPLDTHPRADLLITEHCACSACVCPAHVRVPLASQ